MRKTIILTLASLLLLTGCGVQAKKTTGSYDGITDKLFDIIHHKGAFYYGN